MKIDDTLLADLAAVLPDIVKAMQALPATTLSLSTSSGNLADAVTGLAAASKGFEAAKSSPVAKRNPAQSRDAKDDPEQGEPKTQASGFGGGDNGRRFNAHQWLTSGPGGGPPAGYGRGGLRKAIKGFRQARRKGLAKRPRITAAPVFGRPNVTPGGVAAGLAQNAAGGGAAAGAAGGGVGVAQAIAGLGQFASAITGPVAAAAALGAALWSGVKAIEGHSRELLEAQRHLAKVSPEIARIFQEDLIRQIQRDRSSADRTGWSTSMLADSTNNLSDVLQPMKDLSTNLQNMLMTVINETLVPILAPMADASKFISKWLEKIGIKVTKEESAMITDWFEAQATRNRQERNNGMLNRRNGPMGSRRGPLGQV